ncbi:MAG: hypothetical protein AAF399_27195 [Bacteroidota bacterium]
MKAGQKRFLQHGIPWGITILWVGLLWWAGWTNADSTLVYPLDDTYIHLSLAKNLSQSGSWGLSPGEHQFSSSSPWYTLLMTGGMALFGDQVSLPLWLNLLLLPILLLWLPKVFAPSQHLWGTLAMIVLVPLPTLALFGMEHLWHVLVVLGLLAEMRQTNLQEAVPWKLFFWCALSTGFRYESMFLVGSLSFVFLLQKRPKAGLGCLIAGLLPILGLGLWSVSQGGTFLPLSVLGKGHSPIIGVGGWLGWIMAAAQRLYEHPFLLVLLFSLWMPLWHHGLKVRTTAGCMALVGSLTTLAHVGFAEVGGLRYEAYLLAIGVFVWFSEDRKAWSPGKLVFAQLMKWLIWGLLLFPFVMRTAYFSLNYPLAVQNIYHQQIQSARFLQQHFPKARVAANDIGAISYYTDIQLTDLLGIGDQAVYELQKAGAYQADQLHTLTQQRKLTLAVVHPNWLAPVLPSNWQALQTWEIPKNFICAEAKVQWLSIDPAQKDSLIQALEAFSPQLPPEVLVESRGKP